MEREELTQLIPHRPTRRRPPNSRDGQHVTSMTMIYEMKRRYTKLTIFECFPWNELQVRATLETNDVCGKEFTEILVANLALQFRDKFKCDMRDSRRAMHRLRAAAEHAKRKLSRETLAVIYLRALYKGLHFYSRITREQFEEWAAVLFERVLAPVRDILFDAEVRSTAIVGVTLYGGAVVMPQLRQKLREFFVRVPIFFTEEDEDSDEAEQFTEAFSIARDQEDEEERTEIEVAPLSLGVAYADGLHWKIIERNTPLPCTVRKLISTYENHRNGLEFCIFYGERALLEDNEVLAMFVLDGIRTLDGRQTRIELVYHLNTYRMLTVTATDLRTGQSNKICVRLPQLPRNAIERKIWEAEMNYEADMRDARRIWSRQLLLKYMTNVRGALERSGSILDPVECGRFLAHFNNVAEWLSDNSAAGMEDSVQMCEFIMNLWHVLKAKIRRAQEVAGGAASGSQAGRANSNAGNMASGHVETEGAGHAEAEGAAHAEAEGAVHAEAEGAAHVEAEGAAHVETEGAAHAEAEGAAHVETEGVAHVEAEGAGYVETEGAGHVETEGDGLVEAEGACYVGAEGAGFVQANNDDGNGNDYGNNDGNVELSEEGAGADATDAREERYARNRAFVSRTRASIGQYPIRFAST